MRIGEIWQDREDGSKVKIKSISYQLDEYIQNHNDYLILIADLEGTSGQKLSGKDFLNQYEKCSEAILCNSR